MEGGAAVPPSMHCAQLNADGFAFGGILEVSVNGDSEVKVPSVLKMARWYDRALMNVHAGAAHHPRAKLLAELFWTRIAAAFPGKSDVSCLDICCGEMEVISTIAKQHNKISWMGVDVHPLPSYMRSTSLWKHYERINGMQIGLKAQSFDVGILVDVLNHLAPDRQIDLLKESARVCKIVIIKDHLEYGLISRLVLMAIDFIGSYGLRVRIPRRYFTHSRFVALANRAGLDCQAMDIGIQLYQDIPVIRSLLRPKWQFIAVLRHAPARA
jgi:hypothetical protein